MATCQSSLESSTLNTESKDQPTCHSAEMIPPLAFPIPPGALASVSIIDTTFRVSNIPTIKLMKPSLAGFETLPTVPTWSWLIENQDGRKAIFDLGVPKDRQKSYAPALNARIPESANIAVEHEVAETLTNNGVDLADIESIIWSHWHWDHIGDPTTFPDSTELVVGPGFKDNFLPGYPTNPDSYMMDSHFANRTLREIDFTTKPALKAGNIPAFDFFGDGSFFLLDLPGHAIGHLGGLARTSSNPDTFIFMGGDTCHHGSAIRPSPWVHYPKHYRPEKADLPMSQIERLRANHHTCFGAGDFETLNKETGHTKRQPIFDPAVYASEEDARETVKRAQPADSLEHIFFTFAHDHTMKGIVDEFPSKANDWAEKDWKSEIRWRYLADLIPAVKME